MMDLNGLHGMSVYQFIFETLLQKPERQIFIFIFFLKEEVNTGEGIQASEC